jgi:Flp pilus assembly protein TadB
VAKQYVNKKSAAYQRHIAREKREANMNALDRHIVLLIGLPVFVLTCVIVRSAITSSRIIVVLIAGFVMVAVLFAVRRLRKRSAARSDRNLN